MRTWPIGAAGIALLAFGTAMVLPSTELKSSWTNVHYATPAAAAAVFASPEPATSGPPVYPATPYAAHVSLDSPEPIDTAATEEMRIARDDQAYGDGYSWASDREVADREACYRFHGPRAQGCFDYVASTAPAEVEEPSAAEVASAQAY